MIIEQDLDILVKEIFKKNQYTLTKLNVVCPDGRIGVVSIDWFFEPGNQKKQMKVTLDLGSLDAFPWQLTEDSKENIRLNGYYCGNDLVSFYVNKREEKEKITKLFEWLHENGEFKHILS